MKFNAAVRTCFSKYVTFSGRAARPEYWFFFLFGILALFEGLGATGSDAMAGPAVTIRMLAMLVLAFSALIVLWWRTRPSQPGQNKYGPNPHEVPQ